MSLFAAFETQLAPESKLRYSKEELLGKGLQRLSYFVESQFVTRGFKNHLKRSGIFSPSYRKTDRQQVYLERPPIRRYSDTISNRKFKLEYILKNRTIRGLKELPRKVIPQRPLHVGTIVHSKGVLYPNPLLDRRERKLVRLPYLRARSWLKKTFKKIVRERRTHQEELGGHGPSQPLTNPVSSGLGQRSFASTRVVIVSNDGKYPTLIGGQTFRSEADLMSAWQKHTGAIQFFRVSKTPYPQKGNS